MGLKQEQAIADAQHAISDEGYGRPFSRHWRYSKCFASKLDSFPDTVEDTVIPRQYHPSHFAYLSRVVLIHVLIGA